MYHSFSFFIRLGWGKHDFILSSVPCITTCDTILIKSDLFCHSWQSSNLLSIGVFGDSANVKNMDTITKMQLSHQKDVKVA